MSACGHVIRPSTPLSSLFSQYDVIFSTRPDLKHSIDAKPHTLVSAARRGAPSPGCRDIWVREAHNVFSVMMKFRSTVDAALASTFTRTVSYSELSTRISTRPRNNETAWSETQTWDSS